MSELLIATVARSRRGLRSPRSLLGTLTEFSTQVIAGADDASEFLDTNEVVLNAEQVPLGHATETHRVVMSGARFQSVPLAQGESVPFARLKFTSRYYNASDLGVLIRAHAIANAPAFTTNSGDLSDRTLTTASVLWVPPYWNTNQYDADTWTPDVSAIVQEITSSALWTPGGSIAFLFTMDAGTTPSVGRRYFISFEGDTALAARFEVNTTEEATPAPVVPPDEATYSLTGDETFDASALTPVAQAEHAQLLTEIGSAATAAWCQWYADRHCQNEYSRVFHHYFVAVQHAFRVTGDLRFLDHIDYWMERVRDSLTNEGHLLTGDYAGYWMWLDRRTSASTYGTDTKQNDLKMQGMVASHALALELNRHLTSPAGINYGLRADTWKDYLFGTNIVGDGVYHNAGFVSKCLAGRYSGSSGFTVWDPQGDIHSWMDNMKAYYCMWRLSGEQYLWDNAKKAHDVLWYADQSSRPSRTDSTYTSNPEFREVSTATGTALVNMDYVHWYESARNWLQASNYAGGTYGNHPFFFFEEFGEFGLEARMQAFARAIRRFSLSDSSNTPYSTASSIPSSGAVSADVGGQEIARAGIPWNYTLRRARVVMANQYGHVTLAAWDDTDFVADAFEYIRSQHPNGSGGIGVGNGTVNAGRMTAGLLVNAVLKGI